MGLLADDARFDRRSGLRALFIVLLILSIGFGAAWMTLGRAGRFQALKGVYLSFELSDAFTQIDEEGSGESITSLGHAASIERTYAATLPVRAACLQLERSFRAGAVDVGRVSEGDRSDGCSFTGPVGRFSVEAHVRTPAAFVEHVKAEELDVPSLPKHTRAIATIVVRS